MKKHETEDAEALEGLDEDQMKNTDQLLYALYQSRRPPVSLCEGVPLSAVVNATWLPSDSKVNTQVIRDEADVLLNVPASHVGVNHARRALLITFNLSHAQAMLAESWIPVPQEQDYDQAATEEPPPPPPSFDPKDEEYNVRGASEFAQACVLFTS